MGKLINRDPRHYQDKCHEGCQKYNNTPIHMETRKGGFWCYYKCECGEAWNCWFAHDYLNDSFAYPDCPCTACYLGRERAGVKHYVKSILWSPSEDKPQYEELREGLKN